MRPTLVARAQELEATADLVRVRVRFRVGVRATIQVRVRVRVRAGVKVRGSVRPRDAHRVPVVEDDGRHGLLGREGVAAELQALRAPHRRAHHAQVEGPLSGGAHGENPSGVAGGASNLLLWSAVLAQPQYGSIGHVAWRGSPGQANLQLKF